MVTENRKLLYIWSWVWHFLGNTIQGLNVINVYQTSLAVCGSSSIACVLKQCKAKHSGKGEQQQKRTSFDQLRVQHKCTIMGEINGNILQLPVFRHRHW